MSDKGKNENQGALALLMPTNSELVVSENQWNALRETGKICRRKYTDACQEFSRYVGPDGVGSTRPDKVYVYMTQMIYKHPNLRKIVAIAKADGDNPRDRFSCTELQYTFMVEDHAATNIYLGMAHKWTRIAIKDAVRAARDKLTELYQPHFELAEILSRQMEEDLG